MSSSRIKNLLAKVNIIAPAAMINGAATATVSVVLSRMGAEDHDALSAAAMAGLGTIACSPVINLNNNLYTLYKKTKIEGPVKYASKFLAAEAMFLLAGASIFLLGGKTCEEVWKNSIDFAVYSMALALPLASGAVAHATKLINDFEAQQTPTPR